MKFSKRHYALPLTVQLALCILATVVFPVKAQGVCFFTATFIQPKDGSNVPAGQPLVIYATFSVVCPEGGNYNIRVDVIDVRTSQILSTARTTYNATGALMPEVTINLVAPTATGRWSLQISAYMLDFNGQTVAPPSQYSFGLNVVPYTAQLTSSTVSTTSYYTPQPVSSQIVSQTEAQSTSSLPVAAAPPNQTQLLSVVFGAIVVVLLVLVILTKRRKPHLARSSGEVPVHRETKFCISCRTELPFDSKFCDSCGASQP